MTPDIKAPAHSGQTTPYTVSMMKANIIAMLAPLPLFLILFYGYRALWGRIYPAGFIQNHPLVILAVPLVFVLGIAAHEFLHAFTWVKLGQKNFNLIKFGIDRKTLSPYAHLKEPVNIRIYRWGVLMPGLILGLIPVFFGFILGISPLFLFGIFFTYAAGGDFLVLWLLRKVPGHLIVEDHPAEVGCLVHEDG